MKKIIAIAVLLAAVISLAGCGASGNNTYPNASSDTTDGPAYNVKNQSNYDSEGHLNLNSNDDRYVYDTNTGYLIICFNGNAVTDVYRVVSHESNSKAIDYVNENIQSEMASGEYTNIINVDNYVLYTVSLSNADYGYLYKSSKADAVNNLSALVTEPAK